MKNVTKFFALSIVMVSFAASTFAQVSATATATATIVTPIAIANAANMNFGNVAVSAVGGTVILTPAGTRSTTGGVTLPAVIGTVTAASFTVTGLTGSTYTIAITGDPLTVTSGGNTMTVTTFTSNPTPTGLLAGLGTQTLTVGATLNVAAAQAAGTYLSGTPFTVTVNYN